MLEGEIGISGLKETPELGTTSHVGPPVCPRTAPPKSRQQTAAYRDPQARPSGVVIPALCK
ncbi:hypothetical protein E2C01_013964 [Portunus trituberculatus]|uniref:Uncharacterized protein n=1 Tax=Portunus trituberculatus TaxID=210409 RepID=A0A5B7DHK1_PORTR|nr:hypothetical protein [Portunus trituberculatus]